MGWSITLQADKQIGEADAAEILYDIAKRDVPRETWGWSSLYNGLKVDVSFPKGCELAVSGAWFSAKYGKTAADLLALKLREKGYVVTVSELAG